jgi:hypothetical protein
MLILYFKDLILVKKCTNKVSIIKMCGRFNILCGSTMPRLIEVGKI